MPSKLIQIFSGFSTKKDRRTIRPRNIVKRIAFLPFMQKCLMINYCNKGCNCGYLSVSLYYIQYTATVDRNQSVLTLRILLVSCLEQAASFVSVALT